MSQSSSTASARRLPGTPPGSASSISAISRRLARVVRRAASVGWAVNTGRTDTRPTRSLSSEGVNPAAVMASRVRASQPPALPFGAQGPAPVDLLGDVGQMEIGHEGPHQPGGCPDVHAVQEGRGGVAVLPAARPDPLDQVEDLLALEADKTLTQQIDHPAHIAPQGGIRVVSPGQTPRVVDGSHRSDRGEP